MSTKYVSIFKDPDVNTELSKLHDKFIFVPADKSSICREDNLTSRTFWDVSRSNEI